MAWARVRRGEVIEVFDSLPKGSLKINGKTYGNDIFARPAALAELGIMEIVSETKPDATRFNVTATNTVFNKLTGKVERSYETVERPVEIAKQALLAKVKPAYENKINEGFEYLGNRYDVDDLSIMFMDVESRAASMPAVVSAWPDDYAWRDYDNQLVVMTPSQVIDFSMTARTYRLNLMKQKWIHEATIASLTTQEQVQAYEITWA